MLAPLKGSSFATAVGRLWLGLHKDARLETREGRGGIVKQFPYVLVLCTFTTAACCPEIDPETCPFPIAARRLQLEALRRHDTLLGFSQLMSLRYLILRE